MAHRWLLEIDCRIRPEKQREFRLNISPSLRGAQFRPGSAAVYEDQNEPGHLLLVEEWATLEGLNAYLASDAFLALIGGFQVLGVLHDCRVVDLLEHPESHSASLTRSLKGWHPVGPATKQDSA